MTPTQPAKLPAAELIVVGAAAVDMIARASDTGSASLIANSTVPGTVTSSLGGVGRNVAEAAHRTFESFDSPGKAGISSETLLMAPLGGDAFGALVRGETSRMGMRTDGLLVSSNVDGLLRRTPVCNMVLTGGGELVGGVADFSALDTLEAQEVNVLGVPPF